MKGPVHMLIFALVSQNNAGLFHIIRQGIVGDRDCFQNSNGESGVIDVLQLFPGV